MSLAKVADYIQRRLDTHIEQYTRNETRRASLAYLDLFREHLLQFNLRKHKVTISAGMGSSNLNIQDRRTGKVVMLTDVQASGKVVDELRAIESIMEYTDWVWHLDGEELT